MRLVRIGVPVVLIRDWISYILGLTISLYDGFLAVASLCMFPFRCSASLQRRRRLLKDSCDAHDALESACDVMLLLLSSSSLPAPACTSQSLPPVMTHVAPKEHGFY